MHALPFAAVAVVSLASLAGAQTPVFREDFESGAPGWTFSGIWHIEANDSPCSVQPASSPSPGHYAWYGSQHQNPSLHCDYTTGYMGGALVRDTPVLLPQNPGSIVLRYRRFLDTEHCVEGYDFTRVAVTTVGGQTVLVHATDCANEPGWSDRRIELSAWAGQPVQLRFLFLPTDTQFNESIGWCIDDVEIAAEPGVVTCKAGPACPCPGQHYALLLVQPNEDSGGCRSSTGHEARLFGNGVASVAADTVELVLHDLPHSTSLIYVQGLMPQSVVFGDGRRCFGGTAVRLAVRGVTGGQDTYPHAGESGVALKGSVPAAGGSRTYQVVYRDAATFCTSSTFNTSNGYVIAWMP